MKMEFYVLDYLYHTLGVVDYYKSAIWTERWYEAGDVELYVPHTPYYDDLLKLPSDRHNMYILRADDMTKLGVIDYIGYMDDAESGNMILVKGHTDDYILHYRLLLEQATYRGNVEMIVRHMVENAFIHSDFGMTDRTSTGWFYLGEKVGLANQTSAQFQGEYLDEGVGKLAKQFGFGWAVDFDPTYKRLTFNIKVGVDRSYYYAPAHPVVFSALFDNVLKQTYEKSVAVNAAYAFSDGSGAFKFVGGYSMNNAGLLKIERREGYVDANTSSNGESMDNSSLNSTLVSAAESFVRRDNRNCEVVQADVLNINNYKLGVDYNLGDIVQMIVQTGKKRNESKYFRQRVIEVIECNDETGYSCLPTFETV
jgi:hypothetical protein